MSRDFELLWSNLTQRCEISTEESTSVPLAYKANLKYIIICIIILPFFFSFVFIYTIVYLRLAVNKRRS